MCAVKTPKIKESKADREKPLPVIRNPLLDGILGNIASLRNGRNSLRINLLNPLAIPVGGATGGGGGGGVVSGGGATGGGSTSSGGGSGGGGGGEAFGGGSFADGTDIR